MKLKIDKTITLSLWAILNFIASVYIIACVTYYAAKDNFEKATFFAVIYAILILIRLEDRILEDSEDEEASE